jgi:hypothetical protein
MIPETDHPANTRLPTAVLFKGGVPTETSYVLHREIGRRN